MPNPESRVRIEAFLIDDVNEDKFARHGLSSRQVVQVIGNDHVIIPNRKRRRAGYLVIGIDNGGADIAMSVEPTGDPGVWRPVTAWPCKDHEMARLK